jgi:hypothetical protein
MRQNIGYCDGGDAARRNCGEEMGPQPAVDCRFLALVLYVYCQASTLFITEGDMRSWVKILAVVLICLIGIGIYRGWFSVSRSNPEPVGDKVNVTVTVDKAKMKSDIKKAEEKIEEKVEKIEGKLESKESEK